MNDINKMHFKMR